MARVKRRKLTVDPAEGVTSWLWYSQPAGDITTWLSKIDAGQAENDRFAETDAPETTLPELDGKFDFAVCQADNVGNISDPATFAAWTAVPLDTTPPAPATGGKIVDVNAGG